MKYCERKVFLEEKLFLKFTQPVSLRIAPALSFSGTWSLLCCFLKTDVTVWIHFPWSLWLWKIVENAFFRIGKIMYWPLNSGQCFLPALPQPGFCVCQTHQPHSVARAVPARPLCSWAESPYCDKPHCLCICASGNLLGQELKGSFPIKVALNRREGLCFPVWFRRKALEPLCPLGCRGLWETHRAGHWEGCLVPQLRILGCGLQLITMQEQEVRRCQGVTLNFSEPFISNVLERCIRRNRF